MHLFDVFNVIIKLNISSFYKINNELANKISKNYNFFVEYLKKKI